MLRRTTRRAQSNALGFLVHTGTAFFNERDSGDQTCKVRTKRARSTVRRPNVHDRETKRARSTARRVRRPNVHVRLSGPKRARSPTKCLRLHCLLTISIVLALIARHRNQLSIQVTIDTKQQPFLYFGSISMSLLKLTRRC